MNNSNFPVSWTFHSSGIWHRADLSKGSVWITLTCKQFILPKRRYLLSNIFGTFFNQAKRLLAPSYRLFEAIHHKLQCKGPFKKPLVKGMKGLLHRSLSRKPCEQRTKGNKVGSADPWKAWETCSIHDVTYNVGLQPDAGKHWAQGKK